jgi:hypothetical protein
MTVYLKQSTASQEILLGPFLDATDGDTAMTGLTIANTDIKLWKTGATTLANKNSGGATHISGGLYYAVLDATDTDTLGALIINVHVATGLAVRVECCVLAANVYDSLIGATDTLQVETTSLANNVITTAAINDGAITAAKIASDAITAAKIAADAVTEIQNGLATSAGLTAATANLDVAVSTRLASASYTAPDSAATIATAVWAAGTRTLTAISSGLRNQIADNVLRRTFANAAASADGDTLAFRSLLGAVGKLVNRVGISGGTLTVYREDDTTALGTQAVTTDGAAEPITEVNTN